MKSFFGRNLVRAFVFALIVNFLLFRIVSVSTINLFLLKRCFNFNYWCFYSPFLQFDDVAFVTDSIDLYWYRIRCSWHNLHLKNQKNKIIKPRNEKSKNLKFKTISYCIVSWYWVVADMFSLLQFPDKVIQTRSHYPSCTILLVLDRKRIGKSRQL